VLQANRLELAFFEGVGQFGPKFQIEWVVPQQPFFMSENKMHRSFIRYKNVNRRFVCLVTIHAFVRRTDGRTYRRIYDRQYHVAYSAAR